MPKAEPILTMNPPGAVSRRAALAAAAALPAAALSGLPGARAAASAPAASTQHQVQVSGIQTIARRIRQLVERRDALDDEAVARYRQGLSAEAIELEMDQLVDEIQQLEVRAVEAPAQTLADAAIQASVCLIWAERIANCRLSEAQREEIGKKLLRGQASMLLCVSRAAHMDLNSITWTDLDLAIRRQFPDANCELSGTAHREALPRA